METKKMTKAYTYQLDTSSKKHKCPNWGRKRYVLYINIDTKEYLNETVGRCDREQSCAHHYTPKQYFSENGMVSEVSNVSKFPTVSRVETCEATLIDFIPFNVFDSSISKHERCCLYKYLSRLFTARTASFICYNYFVGTNKDGDTVYWQVDINGNVRQAKAMKYDTVSGRRNKETGAFFAGKTILKNQDANLKQCFFGEYLLSLSENKYKSVAIVESEKTALIASVYYPDYVWLATGGKHGVKWTDKEVCKVLKGRRVVLFPDLGAFELWTDKGRLLEKVAGCVVTVSDVLEQIATDKERMDGLEIADYLLRNIDSTGLALADPGYPVIWNLVNLN